MKQEKIRNPKSEIRNAFVVFLLMIAASQARAASCGGDANHPYLMETINARQGQVFSLTFKAKNPDGVSSPLLLEAIDILIISKPAWVTAEVLVRPDPNVIVEPNEISPCDSQPVVSAETTTASRKLTAIVPNNAAGVFHIVVKLTDNWPAVKEQYYQVDVRVNRAPFIEVVVQD